MTRKKHTDASGRPELRDRLDPTSLTAFDRVAANARSARTEYLAQRLGRAARAARKLLRLPTGGHLSVAAGAKRRPPADPMAGGLTALDPTELHGLIERLEHSKRDLRARVARRAAELDTPAGAPRSDPVYQRLFFALARLREQLASANRELSRRTTARGRSGTARVFSRMWRHMTVSTNEDCFEHRQLCRPVSTA